MSKIGLDGAFDAVPLANDLHKALESGRSVFGHADSNALVTDLAPITFLQAKLIREAYAQLHHKDLLHEVETKLGGKFRHAVRAILSDRAVLDAQSLHSAVGLLSTDHSIVNEILICRSVEEKHEMNTLFEVMFHKDLEHWVDGNFSGDYKKLLLGLIKNKRLVEPDPNATVQNLVGQLFHASEGMIGTDAAKFIEIFTNQSWAQLKQVFSAYPQNHKKHTMETAILHEFSGNIQECLLSMVRFATSPIDFWIDALHRSMAGVGTSDDNLIYVIVSQRENLGAISAAFAAKYGQELTTWIDQDTSGDYRHFLIELVKAHQAHV